MFEVMEDDYLRDRSKDIEDIVNRLLKNLLGLKEEGFSELEYDSIIIAKDLMPSDTVDLDRNRIKGFVTELGGKTSHTAIIANSLDIPYIFGINDLLKSIKNKDLVIMDGYNGKVLVNPEEELVEEYRLKKEIEEEKKLAYEKYKDRPTIAKSGEKLKLLSNISDLGDLYTAVDSSSEGIGLYRTEFLYMNRKEAPSEDEQFKIYKQIMMNMKGKPVTIRTLDIGGDKIVDYLNIPREFNPFLGYRAIRVSLDRRDIFKTQLRAILRASLYGDVKILLPMISSIGQLREAKDLLEEARCELDLEGIKYSPNIELGIMIEVPAVAIQSDIFAREVDFFSIGTNDLIQYTLAVDRGNDKVSDLYDEYHPAVLRLINMTIENAHKNNIYVGMCGEAASNRNLLPVFFGMGLDEYSMNSASILESRHILSQLSKKEWEAEVENILSLSSGREVESYLKGNFSYCK